MLVDASFLNASHEIFAPEMVRRISEAIGWSVDKTREALTSIVPIFTSDVIDQGITIDGASKLLDKVNQGKDQEIPQNISVPGLNRQVINKIMTFIAPVLMGVIKSKIERENLSAYGLMTYLQNQKLLAEGGSRETSEFYKLTGQDPVTDLTRKVSKIVPWRIIALVILVLIVSWFWWNWELINSSGIFLESSVSESVS